MIWLKAWIETRWKTVWMLVFGALSYILLSAAIKAAPASDSKGLLTGVFKGIVFFSLFTAPMLAGSGIETASTRPGESVKGAEGSKLFTLSLPVKRARLFWVRTVTGLLETGVLLALFGIVTWLLLRPLMETANDALETFVVIACFAMAIYAISACLSTFCDEGWRLRISGLAIMVIFALSAFRRLPPAIDIFRSLAAASPLITHQIPWPTIIATVVLAVLFLRRR